MHSLFVLIGIFENNKAVILIDFDYYHCIITVIIVLWMLPNNSVIISRVNFLTIAVN